MGIYLDFNVPRRVYDAIAEMMQRILDMSDFDNFHVDKDDKGQAVAVGGTWMSGDSSVLEWDMLPAFCAALGMSRQFERQMAQIKRDVGGSREQAEQLKEQVINMAVDQEALNTYRYLRVQAGHTDHKALLKKERQLRAWQRMARAGRIVGVELGWLFGFNVRWRFPYVRPDWRPFDWALDMKW